MLARASLEKINGIMKDVFLELGNFLSVGLGLGLKPHTSGHGLGLATCYTQTRVQ